MPKIKFKKHSCLRSCCFLSFKYTENYWKSFPMINDCLSHYHPPYHQSFPFFCSVKGVASYIYLGLSWLTVLWFPFCELYAWWTLAQSYSPWEIPVLSFRNKITKELEMKSSGNVEDKGEIWMPAACRNFVQTQCFFIILLTLVHLLP